MRAEPLKKPAIAKASPLADKTVSAWRRFLDPFYIAQLLLTYFLAIIAGAVFNWLNLPLPWMLGPFFAFAVMSVSGIKFTIMPMGRELGQLAIGTAVGLRFTPQVLLATVELLPAMILATVYVIIFTLIAAFLIKPIARVNDVTAFFATAAGGVADMANVAKDIGGDPGSVAIVHAMRVSCVVAIVPFIAYYFGEQGSVSFSGGNSSSNIFAIIGVLFAGFLAAILLKPTPVPNPWLVGPIVLAVVLGSSGLVSVTIPGIFIVVAQIMMGTWLGCQFKRELLTTLPRVTASAFVIAAFMICCAGFGALVLSTMTNLSYTTSLLALAPAAVSEMVLTAKVLNLDVEIVTAFHVMRIAVVSSSVLFVFKFYQKLKGI